jgi:hypothetical protein
MTQNGVAANEDKRAYADFHARIDQCLDELFTKHKAAMATLLTPKFQTFENVP